MTLVTICSIITKEFWLEINQFIIVLPDKGVTTAHRLIKKTKTKRRRDFFAHYRFHSCTIKQNSLTLCKLRGEQFFCILKHVLSNAVFFVFGFFLRVWRRV